MTNLKQPWMGKVLRSISEQGIGMLSCNNQPQNDHTGYTSREPTPHAPTLLLNIVNLSYQTVSESVFDIWYICKYVSITKINHMQIDFVTTTVGYWKYCI